ncbi:MAG: hypothetical protein ACM3ML_26415 [Micromonosporaceae bacterium]
MDSRGRSWLAVVGWLAAAAAATTVGVVAVAAVGTSVVGTPTQPISDQQVDRALARATQTPARPPTTTPATTPGGITRSLTTRGGTVIARCLTGQATLLSWSPAQGYDTENVRAGPAPAATLTFEAEHTEIRVRIDCPAGIPTAHTTTHADQDRDQD